MFGLGFSNFLFVNKSYFLALFDFTFQLIGVIFIRMQYTADFIFMRCGLCSYKETGNRVIYLI